MLRAFKRDAQIHSMVHYVSQSKGTSDGDISAHIAQHLLHENREARGTVESIAQELAYVADDVLSLLPISLDPPSNQGVKLSDCTRASLYKLYNHDHKQVYYPTEANVPRSAHFLQQYGQVHDYALVDGRRIMPVTHSSKLSAASAIVKVDLNGNILAGEVMSVFEHFQGGVTGDMVFAEMQWMKQLDRVPISDDIWSD
ncbi:hypothetical protein SCP_0604340 [Sparassis crispa]|uniref:Uncharacterized protein n=1 Tax=Sparassis crispa TaxID=139825 RepID=A0A401GQI0_9APHY|nr:hypothetical protein SCP_0604340 [Sparassis crispa]GBE84455.1 hypothetical protein SCP_0604340 [Sparassis crispa]